MKRLRRELEWIARRLPMAEDQKVREALVDQIKSVQQHIEALIGEDRDPAAEEAAQLLHARTEIEHILHNLSQLVAARCLPFPTAATRGTSASEP